MRIFLLWLSLWSVFGRAETPVHRLEIDGVINPLSARYLERGIDEAAAAGAPAVLLRLNTPGGLDTSMRAMVQSILNAPLPVIVYVAPQGARAASAGMFIAAAAHVAAMAPGTNIGAAHPVALGESEGQEKALEKSLNDAAALARALAGARHRNGRWMERAVRRSDSLTAEEAARSNVVDFVADGDEAVLEKAHGRTVAVEGGTVVVRTAGSPLQDHPMSLPERILHTITDPNIAYLLMFIGLIGLVVELYSPGGFVAGTVGAISLLLAFAGLGSLPVGWAGLLLLALGIALVVVDVSSQGFGLLGAGGAVAFVLGSLMLYRPLAVPDVAMPQVRVEPWLIGAMTALVVGMLLVVAGAVWRGVRRPVLSGKGALVGTLGTAATDLAPLGTVRLGGETWSAETEGETIPAGEPVEVVDVRGVRLLVRRATGESRLAAG